MTAARSEPRTTLACVDTRYPALALRALRLSMDQCGYESVKLFTCAAGVDLTNDARVECILIPSIATSQDYSHFMLKSLHSYVQTDFVQVIQWDGYVCRGEAWTDEFLDYDFIGARWWFRPEGTNVGNGGFSLRSRKLLNALQDPEIEAHDPEDNTICLEYRELLERRHGIRFAPGPVADRYAFEGEAPTGRELGFHRIFNLPFFHGEAELALVLDALPAADFSAPASVTLVEKLAALGRLGEALRYAKRIRGEKTKYASLPPRFRQSLERSVLGLVARTSACPCGSHRAFKRCCGEIEKWEVQESVS